MKVKFIDVHVQHMGRLAEESVAFYENLQQTIQRFLQQSYFVLGELNAEIRQ